MLEKIIKKKTILDKTLLAYKNQGYHCINLNLDSFSKILAMEHNILKQKYIRKKYEPKKNVSVSEIEFDSYTENSVFKECIHSVGNLYLCQKSNKDWHFLIYKNESIITFEPLYLEY